MTLAEAAPAGSIFCVLGTRPEVIKMAPVVAALKKRGLRVCVVATGQHYNWQMMGSIVESFVSDRASSRLHDSLRFIVHLNHQASRAVVEPVEGDDAGWKSGILGHGRCV